MSRRSLWLGACSLGLLASFALTVPAHAARPVVGPQPCKYNAHIMYDYDCDGSYEVGVNDLYSTPTACRYAVDRLIANAQYYGFCWALPPLNCLPTPTNCYEEAEPDPGPGGDTPGE